MILCMCGVILLLSILTILSSTLYHMFGSLSKSMDNSQHLLFVMRKWDSRDEQQKNYLENKLRDKGYKKIAVYGCCIVGKRMERELENSDINIEYFIDKNRTETYKGIPVLHNTEALTQVDAIIVTVVSQYYAIRDDLQGKVRCPIIALEELL